MVGVVLLTQRVQVELREPVSERLQGAKDLGMPKWVRDYMQ